MTILAVNYKLQHSNHLLLVFNQLAEDETFMDVTLTAEGRPIKAHKVSVHLMVVKHFHKYQKHFCLLTL